MQLADPSALGFNPERLAAIDRYLQQIYVGPGLFPGVQLLIARDGQPLHFASMGIARADGAPLGPDALFRIASMTKPITSVAYMMLVEEGRTALDQPVHEVIPEWRDLGVYDGGGAGVPFRTRRPERPMMMVDLLRHTSGLTYGFQNRTNVDAAYRARKFDNMHADRDLESYVAELADLPLEFSPGTAWNYSVATDVLGLVIQRVSGQPLDKFLQARIFDPLGMVDTNFHVPADKAHRLGDVWSVQERGNEVLDAAATSKWLKQPRFIAGGAGLVSTTADYHRFCQMLVGGGALDGVRIISPKTLALMTANHLPGNADLTALSQSLFSEATYAGQGFGLGFAVNMSPASALLPGSVGEFYWGGMFSTAFFVDPVEGVHMVFMAQLTPSSTYPIRRQLRTLVYAALEESRA